MYYEKLYDSFDSIGGVLSLALIFFFAACFLYVLYEITILQLRLVAEAFIFEKAKRNPWLTFVPFYSSYLYCNIATDNKGLSVVYCLLHFVYSFCGLYHLLGCHYFNFDTNSFDHKTIIILWLVLILTLFILSIIININLAKRFGKGTGFAIGLIFFNLIFECILAFGKSEYIQKIQEQNYDNDLGFQEDQMQNDDNTEKNQTEINDSTQDKEINSSSK